MDQGQKKSGVLLTIALCSTKGPLGVYDFKVKGGGVFSGVKYECLPPKVNKFTFYNISSSLLMLSTPKFLWPDKSMFALRNKNVFDGKPKMTKTFEFENLKIPNPDIWPFLGDFQIFKFNFFFVIFGFPLKRFLFLKAKILLSYQKHFWADSINREEYGSPVAERCKNIFVKEIL